MKVIWNDFNRKSLAILLIVSMLLPAIIRVPFALQAESSGAVISGDGKILLNNFQVEVLNDSGDYVPLTYGMSVKKGDLLRIRFDWEILNQEAGVTDFEVDMTEALQNVLLENASNEKLMWSSQQVGSADVTQNTPKVTFHLYEWFLDGSNRKGNSIIDAEVNFGGEALVDGQEVPIKVGTFQTNVKYDAQVPESSLLASKKAEGGVAVNSLGKPEQKFVIELEAKNGDVTGIHLVDEWDAETLKNPGSITANVDGVDMGTFSDLSALNGYLSGMTLAKDKKITLSYVMELDETVYTQNKGAVNKLKKETTYVTNTGNTKDIGYDRDAWATVQRPEVNKTGSLDESAKEITWTVTIRLGDYKALGTFDELVTSVTDTPGANQTLIGALAKEAFTETAPGSGIYVATCKTKVSDASLNSSDGAVWSNQVTAVINGVTYEKTGSVGKTGTTAKHVEKAFVKYDADSQKIIWEVELKQIPTYATQVKVYEKESKYGSSADHLLSNEIWLGSKKIVDSNGAILDAGIVADYQFQTYNDWSNGYSTLVFQDAYIQGKSSVKLTYVTTVKDVSVTDKPYVNQVSMEYKSPYRDELITDAANAAYYLPSTETVLTKTGSAIGGKCAASYVVWINLQAIENLQVEKYIEVVDKAGEGKLVIDESSVTIEQRNANAKTFVKGVNNWKADTGVTVTSQKQADGSVLFRVPVSQAMLDQIAYDKGKHESSFLLLEYVASVNPEYGTQFYNKTSDTFTNTASGKYETQDFVPSDATVTLTPQQVIFKNAVYNEDTAPVVKYVLDINPQALKLSSTGKLKAKDVMADALKYDLLSVKLYEVDKNGVRTATSDLECNYVSAENAMEFTLPDEKHLQLEYEAYVKLAAGATLNSANSKNTIELIGYTRDETKTENYISSVVFSAKHNASNTTDGVYIQKIFKEDGIYKRADGSTFSVTKCSYDAATDVITEVEAVGADKFHKVTSAGELGKVQVDELLLDNLYVIREQTCDEKFQLNAEPIYFVIKGDNFDSYTFPANAQIITSFDTLFFENQLKPSGVKMGSLRIEKDAKGVDWENVPDTLKFTISKGGTVVKTVSKADLDLEHGYTIGGLAVGNYVVKEEGGTLEGYGLTVTAGTTVGTSATVKVTDGTVPVVIKFTNDYKKDEGKLVITKTILGPVTKEEAAGALKFKVTDSEGTADIYTLTDFTYNAGTKKYTLQLTKPIGIYTVEEMVYDVSGYVTESVKYTIGSGTQVEGKTATATVTKNVTTTVAYEDTYSEMPAAPSTGKLVITKTISGPVTQEEAEGALKFKVTDSESVSTVYTLKDFSYDSGTKTYVLELTKPVGSYTVEETVSDISGYVNVSVKYTVDAQATETGKSAKAEVAKDTTTKVAFEDSYSKVEAPTPENPTEPATTAPAPENPTTPTSAPEPATTAPAPKNPTKPTSAPEPATTAPAPENPTKPTSAPEPATTAPAPENPTKPTSAPEPTTTAPAPENPTTAPAPTVPDSSNPPAVMVGVLVITKTIEGPVTREEAEGALQFAVTRESTGETTVYALKDFDYDAANNRYVLTLTVSGNEKYSVMETVKDIAGYKLTEVTATTVEGTFSTDTVSLLVSNGVRTTIAYKDAYEKPEIPTVEAPQDGRYEGEDDEAYWKRIQAEMFVKTGDTTPVGLYLLAVVLSLIVLVGSAMAAYKKKRA